MKKFALTLLAASIGATAAGVAAAEDTVQLPENSQATANLYTVFFHGLGTDGTPYDGAAADVGAALKQSPSLMQLYITTAKTDDANNASTNGESHVVFDELQLVNDTQKTRTIRFGSGAYDLAAERHSTAVFANSAIKGWDIEVETLNMRTAGHDGSALAETGHVQSIAFVNSSFEGDIVHSRNIEIEKSSEYDHLETNHLTLSLDGSTWTGALRSIKSESVQHSGKLPNGQDGTWYQMDTSADNKTPHESDVALKHSTWNVTGNSYVTKLTLEGGSTVEILPTEAAAAALRAASEGTSSLNVLEIEELGRMDSGSKFVLNKNSAVRIDASDAEQHVFEFKSLDSVLVSLGDTKEDAEMKLVANGKLNDGNRSVTELVDGMMQSVMKGQDHLQSADYEIGEGVWTNGLMGTAERSESGEILVTPGAETVNANAAVVAETTGVSLMQWRAEINDLNKRLGELRGQSGKTGAWARTYFGRSEYGSQQTEADFRAIQVGGDRLLTNSGAQVWAGAAFSYTTGDTDFSRGSGEMHTYALTAYASTLFENGSFIDATLKYGRLRNEFDIHFCRAISNVITRQGL